ncbi:hypothetical protein EMCRGX_G001238 [Ephydatia muelleri]
MACQEASTITSICIRPSDDVCLNVCVDPCDDAGMFENSDGDSNGLDLSDNDTFLNLDSTSYGMMRYRILGFFFTSNTRLMAITFGNRLETRRWCFNLDYNCATQNKTTNFCGMQ